MKAETIPFCTKTQIQLMHNGIIPNGEHKTKFGLVYTWDGEIVNKTIFTFWFKASLPKSSTSCEETVD